MGLEFSRVLFRSIMGSIKEKQTVHKYQNFRTSDPETKTKSDENLLTQLSANNIMLLVAQAQRELETWGETIFGKTEKVAGVDVTKQWTIPRTTADSKNTEEYSQAEKDKETDVTRLTALQTKGYENLSEAERDELTRLSDSIVNIRDGKLGEHIGYAPVFKSGESLDLKNSKEQNVESKGRGEMGAIMLDFQWNSMIASQGFAELGKPMYDRKLWDDDGSLIEPPTIRSVTDIALTIAGNALGPGIGSVLLGYVDDLLFAGFDLAGGYKTAAEVGNALGKKMLSDAVGAGVGALGKTVGSLEAVTKFAGSGTFGKVVTDMGIAGLTSSVNLVANTAINSMDLSKIGQGGFFNTGMFTTTLGDSKSWAEVVSSMTGAGVTSGMNAWNIGTKGIKVDGCNSSQIVNMGSLNRLVENGRAACR